MTDWLCFTVHLLDGCFHGQDQFHAPEWPPSPLRFFEALVAAAAARWNERVEIRSARNALEWLECQKPPLIVAPSPIQGQPIPFYGPDNVGDLVGRSWARGGAADVAEYRTQKIFRPLYLSPTLDSQPLYYLYPLQNPPSNWDSLAQLLTSAARVITHLGWGIDMVVADAVLITHQQAVQLPGQRWFPTEHAASVRLRAPRPGTLRALSERREAFLNRLRQDNRGNYTFVPVPELTQFEWVGYRRPFDLPLRPWVAFRLLRPPQPDSLRSSEQPMEEHSLLVPSAPPKTPPAFVPTRSATHLAAMLRNLTAKVSKELLRWVPEKVLRQVLGHEPAPPDRSASKAIRQDPWEPRFAYLPLPTVHAWGAPGLFPIGAIRRLLLVGMPGMEEDIRLLGQYLLGQSLHREQDYQEVAILAPLNPFDWVLQRYLRPSASWTSVTPVVLPGYDDRSDKKTEALLRKALVQAGLPPELVHHAELDWSKVGFLPGLDLASRYRRPQNIQHMPVWHVKITWRDPQGNPIQLPGPISIGSGRFRGLGLLVSLDP